MKEEVDSQFSSNNFKVNDFKTIGSFSQLSSSCSLPYSITQKKILTSSRYNIKDVISVMFLFSNRIVVWKEQYFTKK